MKNANTIMRRLLRSRLLWAAVLVAAAALAIVVLLRSACTAARHTEVSIGSDQKIGITPQQIESIKAIGEWEFLSIADEELVDTTRKGLFTDDHLVRIYYGTVRLGINMHQVSPGWLTAEGDSLTARLPAISLLSRDFIDEARTKSFHESGRWSAADRDLLYRKAYRQMLAHCMTRENLNEARASGEQQFLSMMRALGYSRVGIVWEDSQ
ncbi:MAG: DUF4230 domain-containing protein [Prevotella sp.]|nr:DUF4230 domain-containing protein [Prevotella sp.]